MNCSRCGSSIPDENPACPNCGLPRFAQSHPAPPPPPPPPRQPSYTLPSPPPPTHEPVKNYIIQSVIVTICCCQPIGIIAIVFSAIAMSKQSSGDIAGAREMASRARLFCWIGFGIGIASWIVFGLIYGTAGFLEFFERTAG